MAIPASTVVSVTPRVITAGGEALEMSGLFITKNELCPTGAPKEFGTATAVGNYFGIESDEYKVAAKYFLGYDNSFKKPKAIWFARYLGEAVPAAVIGGTADSLADLKEITDGTLTMTINGAEVEIEGLDFSAATTQSEIADIVSQKLDGATVTYNAYIEAFIVTSEKSDFSSSVSAATGTAASALGLSLASGAVLSEYAEEQSAQGQMEEITNRETNWMSFSTMFKPTYEEIEGYATWSNNQNVDYLYVCWTEDAGDTVESNSENLPNKLAENDYEGVVLLYAAKGAGLFKTAFLMGTIASIDWNRRNGLPDFKFRKQSGLAADVTEDVTATALQNMKVNFYGKYATRADEFTFLAEGEMFGGNYDWIDSYVAMVWLKNAIQLACMTGFVGSARVGYNEAGYTKIRAWLIDPINQGKLNGAIEAGVSLSEQQKAELVSEIGSDKSVTIYTDGYYLEVSDPGASVRQSRGTPVIGLWFTYAGAVHRLDIPVTLIK